MVGLEALLGQEQWVRRLARALMRDDDEAEDVVQEARLAVWRHPPRDPTRARSWLGTVVRNTVRNRRRAAASRDGRELAGEGRYTLMTGFWNPADDRRLPVLPRDQQDGKDRLRVATITVD